MERKVTESTQYRELVDVVSQVRKRWRMKLMMRGLAALVVLMVVTFLISAFAIGGFDFAPAAIITARVMLAAVFLVALGALVLPPLWKRVTDEQVALYLEEREPSLRSSLIGALAAGSGESHISPALARRTIETALVRCREIEAGRALETESIRRSSLVAAGVLAAGLALAFVSPLQVREGAKALFMPLRTTAVEAAPMLRIDVLPGDTTVARGADLPVFADLIGFGARGAELNVRFAGEQEFERIPMIAREGEGGYDLRLFSLQGPTEYYVSSAGVQSPTYRVEVVELPYVAQLMIELDFPDYTGLENQVIEAGGDIYAPSGTRVTVRALPTMPVVGGRIAFDEGGNVDLALDGEGALVGVFQIEEPTLYEIQLQAEGSDLLSASPEYLIEIMDDMAPRVVISDPGRDIRVTLVDEVYLEAQATDDFGVRSLELVYSVNGGEERVQPLYSATPLQEVSAGHTFYLEDLDLQAGDFIAYYARASDVGPDPRQTVSSDMYFVEVRPFGVEYRQADQQGGGGGGGGQGQQGADDELSRRQRELISATFNVIRDRESYTGNEFEQNIEALSTAQDALRRQALTLAQRLTNRGAVQDTTFDIIAESLPMAADEMMEAVRLLMAMSPEDALPAEQRALVHLQRAEAAFREVQVSLGSQGGGGSSGGMGPSAEDLADLFGLELDQLRNQYETVQRGQGEQAATEVDQSLDRIRELARRLERQNDELRQAMSRQIQAGGSGDAQRQLAEEMMEEARQLERLSREQRRPELAEAARELQEAAEAMRRAAAEQRSGNAGATRDALDRLRDATRRLERDQAAGLRETAEDIAQRARRMAQEQRNIAREFESLPPSGADRARAADRIMEQKNRQAAELEEMRRSLERLSAEARRDQPDAARNLRAAADAITRNQLPERIRMSRANTQPNMPVEYGRRIEREIQDNLDEFERLASEASRSIQDPQSQGDQSLDRARDLVAGLQSMQERLRQGQEGQQQGQGQEDQQGQQGQGQEGQQGQQGQGQQGQEGQQGQGGGASQQGGQQSGGGGVDGTNQGARFGSGGRYVPWNGNPEEMRQFRSELRQRINEAEALRQQLVQDGLDPSELDGILRDLRELDSDRNFEDSGRLSLLQEAVLDKLKQFEFNLYRAIRGDTASQLFLSGNADVPPEFREMVERYYRDVAEGVR